MKTKQVGILGVGAMGGNVARMLYGSGYSLVLYNKTEAAYAPFVDLERVTLSSNLADFAKKLGSSQDSSVVWMMIPGGSVTNAAVSELSTLLRKNDIVIDASNSSYVESMANYEVLKKKGIHYLDVGCCGGPDDLLTGVTLMVGGDRKVFEKAADVLEVISGNGTYGYVGSSGAGHKFKLLHNTIFYDIFPAWAEATEMMLSMEKEDPKKIFDIQEGLRLLQASPPITTGIPKAISKAIKQGLPKDAPPTKISPIVNFGVEHSNKLGVSLSITKAILAGYTGMSKQSKGILELAKKILTGH